MQVYSYHKEWPQAFNEIKSYLKNGKMKTRETIYDFNQMPQAFIGLFKGENIGKALVKYTPPEREA